MAKRVRAVLAGCGGICGAWLGTEAVKKRVEIVGLVDLRREAARKRQDEFGLEKAVIGTELGKVLRATKPAVVFDCTVPEAHVGVTLTALKAGCHVLGEKPLADTMANARRMVAAAKRAKRIYAVIQNRRYMAEIRALRRFVESGKIGRITTVQSQFYIGAHFGGFRDRMEHVLLLDMAIHTFDAARLITGADAESVYCHEWNPKGSWYDHDASAVAVFEMTGGIVYTYTGSWCSEGANTSWEAEWRVIGTKGTAMWDGKDRVWAEASQGAKGFIRPVKTMEIAAKAPAKKIGGHGGVIGEFLDCVEKGCTPETAAADNIKSLAMVHGAIEAAKKECRVRVRA